MNFINYVTLYEEAESFPVVETRDSDIIFGGRGMIASYYNTSIENDPYFKKPDYERYVFSSNCEGVYFMDERNIPLPIYHHSTIDKSLRNHLSNNVAYKENNGAGIYVVERYIIKIKEGKNYNDIIKAYTSMDAIVDVESRDELAKYLRSTTPTEGVYRVVTYIPNSEMNYHKYIYSKHCNLCFIKGLPGKEALHPKSIERQKLEKVKDIDYSEHTNLISLDIIDNKNPHKAYYVNISNKVHKLFSHINNTREDGCEMIIKTNDEISGEYKYKLNEFEENGIYDSEDKAKYMTDTDGILKHMKMENETKKLNITDKKNIIEDSKVKLAFSNLNHATYSMLIDKEMKKMTFKATSLKLKMDYESQVLSYNREERLFKEKLIVEQMKTAQTTLSTITSIFKIFF